MIYKELLKKNLLAILVIVSLFTVALFSLDRSMWVDEAMLFVNMAEIEFINIFEPLPYYDQASPVLPLAIQMLAQSIFNFDFVSLRLVSLLLSLTALIIFIFNLPKEVSKNIWLSTLTFAIVTFLYYATEIKHYSFEFSSSLFLLITYFSYLNKKYLKGFFFSIIGLMLGFSNIIALGVIVGFILLYKIKNKELDIKFIKYFSASIALLLPTYLGMKYLTESQISYDVYSSKGLIGDTIHLFKVVYGAHGIYLTLMIASLLPAALLSAKNEKILYTFSLFYLCLIFFIFILKITSFYPVISSRHLYWLSPFSITLVALTFQMLINKYRLNKNALLFVCIFFFIINSYRYINNNEHTANNRLIYEVNQLCIQKDVNLIGAPVSDKVLYTYQKSYDSSCFSTNVDISVQGHFYHRLMKRLELFDYSKRNYLVFTHFDITEVDHSYYGWLQEALKLKGLNYEIYYQGKNVAILHVFK